jgi:hypothetical protein
MWTGGEDEKAVDLDEKAFGLLHSLIDLCDCQLLPKVAIPTFALDGDDGAILKAAVEVNSILSLAFTAVLIESAAKYAAHKGYRKTFELLPVCGAWIVCCVWCGHSLKINSIEAMYPACTGLSGDGVVTDEPIPSRLSTENQHALANPSRIYTKSARELVGTADVIDRVGRPSELSGDYNQKMMRSDRPRKTCRGLYPLAITSTSARGVSEIREEMRHVRGKTALHSKVFAERVQISR